MHKFYMKYFIYCLCLHILTSSKLLNAVKLIKFRVPTCFHNLNMLGIRNIWFKMTILLSKLIITFYIKIFPNPSEPPTPFANGECWHFVSESICIANRISRSSVYFARFSYRPVSFVAFFIMLQLVSFTLHKRPRDVNFHHSRGFQ